MNKVKIVVLTPVKNEDWILDRFLSVTSMFADHIIIADQQSTDESQNIYKRFDKVVVIENPDEQYDEAKRQLLLIEAARELFPGPKILMALDADEILAADALDMPGWKTAISARPGTVLCFEKPDILPGVDQCLVGGEMMVIGYVDDGAPHSAQFIHSTRVPAPHHAIRLNIHDVKFLHYAIARPEAQSSKVRRYSVVENLNYLGSVHTALKRRYFYNPYVERTKFKTTRKIPQCWFEKWENIGIDMKTIPMQKFYWQDFEVLRSFNQHGIRRFWFEKIWDFNWEECRKYAKSIDIQGIPGTPILKPSVTITLIFRVLDFIYASSRAWLSYLRLKAK